MRKDDAWVLYQKARAAWAKAEIAVIEKRAAAEAADAEFDRALAAETKASDEWRRLVGKEMDAIEPGAEA
jgi:cytochrome oxidase assembly protein ShyY1